MELGNKPRSKRRNLGITIIKGDRNMSEIAAQPGDVIDFSQAEMPVKIDDRTIFPEDRGTGYAMINAMTVASKDMGLERMHDVAKIAGNVSKVMKVVC